MPGYLPESDPYVAESWEGAKAYMVEELRYHADNAESWADDHDCDDIPCPTYGDDCPWNNATQLRGEADHLESTYGATDGWDGWSERLHYWISPCSDAECESALVAD